MMLRTERVPAPDEARYFETKFNVSTGYSRYIKIINNSKKKLVNVAIASLDYRHDPMWSDVINVPDVGPGKSKIVDLTKFKYQIIEFKIKWYAGGVRNLFEQPHRMSGQWEYYTAAEFTVDDIGYFMSLLSWEQAD